MSLTNENLVRSEQRNSKRVSTLKKGKIIFDDGHCVVECTIRNTSETGAGVQLPGFVELPPTFMLAIEGGAKRPCAVAWSSNEKLGVHYIDGSSGRQTESPGTGFSSAFNRSKSNSMNSAKRSRHRWRRNTPPNRVWHTFVPQTSIDS